LGEQSSRVVVTGDNENYIAFRDGLASDDYQAICIEILGDFFIGI
jgi:hypothetical protein